MVASVETGARGACRDQASSSRPGAEARLKPLRRRYITKNEYEVALTQSKSLQATVESNRAALEQAKCSCLTQPSLRRSTAAQEV